MSSYAWSSVPYPGGGEISSALSRVQVEGEVRYPYGQHNIQDWDTDGNFEDVDWGTWSNPWDGGGMTFEDIENPGITIESTHPYYLEEVRGTYIEADETTVADAYEKEYWDGSVHRYNLLLYGFDVTIKTKADAYYKDPAVFSYFSDYGYWYEDNKLDVLLRQSFALNPWTPAGIPWNESYHIDSGWAGIMQAELYDIDFGLVQAGADENKNHVIENLHTVGSALNMYELTTDNVIRPVAFKDASAISGVISAVDVELGASLQAGAQYHVDALGKVDSLAVRNVFVTYRVIVKVIATLQMSFVTEGTQMDDTQEDNTFYKPQIPITSDLADVWNEFWADVGEWLRSPEGIFYTIIIVLVVAVVIIILIKGLIWRFL